MRLTRIRRSRKTSGRAGNRPLKHPVYWRYVGGLKWAGESAGVDVGKIWKTDSDLGRWAWILHEDSETGPIDAAGTANTLQGAVEEIAMTMGAATQVFPADDPRRYRITTDDLDPWRSEPAGHRPRSVHGAAAGFGHHWIDVDGHGTDHVTPGGSCGGCGWRDPNDPVTNRDLGERVETTVQATDFGRASRRNR